MLEQLFSCVYTGNKFVDNKKIPGYWWISKEFCVNESSKITRQLLYNWLIVVSYSTDHCQERNELLTSNQLDIYCIN